MIRAGSAARRSFTRSANTGGPLILDVVGVSAAAAYSLRRLRAAYTGAAVNIRRSSDSTTQDIGFVNGSLDTSALATFIGTGSGFVAKWYDQSGNVNDAVQATTANQPSIALSVTALNTRPAILFVDAGGLCLGVVAAASINNMFAAGGLSMSVVNLTGTPTQADRIWDKGQVVFRFEAASSLALHFTQVATGQGDWATAAMSTGAHLLSLQYSSASLSNIPTVTQDAVALGAGAATQPTGTVTSDAATNLQIGSNAGGGTRGFPGHIAEQIFWKTSVPTAGQITTLRADQKAYWGTP